MCVQEGSAAASEDLQAILSMLTSQPVVSLRASGMLLINVLCFSAAPISSAAWYVNIT